MSAADRPYNNSATREERAEALRNEQRLRKQEASQPTTYHKLAGLSDDLGGRYKEKETISGEQATTQYPKIPGEGGPWSSGDNPVEPPTGVAIDAQEPCGEFFEVEQSIAQGEPTDAITQPQSMMKRTVGVGSPPTLGHATLAPTVPVPAVVDLETSSVAIPDEQPEDGLDGPRRSDGTPLSTSVDYSMTRRKLKWTNI
jgi:hypothetical protein